MIGKSIAILLIHAALCSAATTSLYRPYQFHVAENWRISASGDPGSSSLNGGKWVVDFGRGAKWISLAPPDRVLLGSVVRLRLRVRGSAAGHRLRIYLRTHFMTFDMTAPEVAGSGEREIVLDGPPGPGWKWSGGENDGKIHGPIRVGEIRLESNGHTDRLELEMLSLAVEARTEPERRCVLTASAGNSDGPPAFQAQVRCLGAEPLAGKLAWRLRDWEGAELASGELPVTAPAAAEPVSVPIVPARLPQGRRFLEAEFQLSLPGQEVPAAQACWVAKQAALEDAALRPESPFGMGVYLGRYRGADLERAARTAREAGVKWSREDFAWARIEPARGQYEWSFYDNLVATAIRNGISVYAIVGYWTPWTKPYTEEGMNDYVAFTRQLVRRYKRDIHQWEIWNEPNIFFWQGPREMYGTLLQKSYAAIKEEDPSAQVLGLSTAGIDYNFIARTMARGAPFDILTIHPYRKVLEDQVFIDELKIVSDMIRRPSGRRPVWLTEMGWSTFTPHHAIKQDFEPTTLRAQAQLLARTYLCAIASGVEPRTFWYDFRNDGDDPLYFENEMGILRRDFEPKPAYIAFQTLARVLAGRKLVGVVPAPTGVLAYRFDTVIAAWSPAADATLRLQTKSAQVVRVNAVGEESALTASGGAVRIDLKKGAPVYVKGI